MVTRAHMLLSYLGTPVLKQTRVAKRVFSLCHAKRENFRRLDNMWLKPVPTAKSYVTPFPSSLFPKTPVQF